MILLACSDVPGWGGASTRAYQLFERLQHDGWNVVYLNLVRHRDETFLRTRFGEGFGNPRALPDVHTHILDEPLGQPQPALAGRIRAVAPDAMVGFGVSATNLLRAAAPRLPLVFMTVGSHRVEHLVATGAVRDFMAFQALTDGGTPLPAPRRDPERQAVEASDRIIVHSPLVRFVLERCSPAQRRKVHPSTVSLADLAYAAADAFAALRRPFAERDIDVLFVASSWRRAVKNYALVREIAARCAGVTVHVVGAFDDPCPNARHHGFVASRHELFELLGRCKTLVSPSLVDAAPGVLFEASAMDCNVVATRNCGNWQLCHEELVAERCQAADFVSRIRRSLTGRYPDGRDRFRNGYGEFVRALEQFRSTAG